MGQKQSQFQEYKREQKLRQNPDKIQGLTRVLSAQSENDRFLSEQGRDVLVQNKQSMKMLKNLFKTLDPSVIKPGGQDCGQIEISLKFNDKQSLLLVKIEQCHNLKSRDIRSSVCDPYVKLSLVPDPSRQGEKCTKVSRSNCNPVYQEIFAYSLAEKELKSTKLFIQVLDYDRNEKDEFLGQAIIPLNDLDLTDQLIHTERYSLEIKSDLGVGGDLDLSLGYRADDDGQHLLITVHGSQGLHLTGDTESSETYVKVTVPGTRNIFQTESKAGTSDPVWEQTFDCDIRKEDFHRRFVVFDVKAHDRVAGSEVSLGQVVILLEEFDYEKTLRERFSLADLTNSDLLQDKLSQDPATLELREALQAHANVKYPSFIFQQPMGNKVLTLTARKARSQAKIRIMDGIPVY